MKLLRAILILTLCSTMWFTMGANGCGGQIQDVSLAEGVDTTAAEFTMPIVTTVSGLPEGADPALEDPCLLNYVPDEINFIAYVNLDDASDTLNRFGFDKFDDAVKQELNDLISYLKEAVGFAYDDGQWGVLVRPKGDMTEFVNDYLTPKVATTDNLIARVLDNSAVILSFSQEINQAVADKVAQGVAQECAFVRFMRYDATPLSEKPMINMVAKAKTTMLDQPLETVLPGIKEEIQKAMAVLNIDKKEGVFRFAIGITDNTDPYIASVITYFSFYIDTDSYIMSTLIDKFMEEAAAGNIQFVNDGDDGGAAPGN